MFHSDFIDLYICLFVYLSVSSLLFQHVLVRFVHNHSQTSVSLSLLCSRNPSHSSVNTHSTKYRTIDGKDKRRGGGYGKGGWIRVSFSLTPVICLFFY